MAIFNELLHRPLVNLLAFLYEHPAFRDFGVAIIMLTVIIRLVLFPLFHKTAQHQRINQKLQPHIKKIQETHKDNREAQTKAMMALYSEHNINPLTPILLLIVQLPILIALYQVFRDGFSEKALEALYPFVSRPEVFNTTLFGLIDLNSPNIAIVLLAAAAQYFQGKASMPKHSGVELTQAEQIGRKMIFIGPVLTLVILWTLPAALGIYWLTSTLFSLLQQKIVDRKLSASTVSGTGKEAVK